MPESAMTMPERRQTRRTKIDEIVYVDMGPENGGVVLDVSEGGLAFCAAIPIHQTEIVQFSLFVRGKGRVDGAGGVAWTDNGGRKCGLRFTSTSVDVGERLRRWADPAYTATLTLPQTSFAPPQLQTPAVTDAEEVSLLPHLIEAAGTDPTVGSSNYERGPFDPLTAEDLASISPRLQLTAGAVLRATVVALLVVGLAAGAYFYGTRFGESWIGPSAYSVANSNPQPKLAAARTSNQEGGQSELEGALEYLRAPSGQRDTTSAMRLLRAAMKSGNSSAEVVLAEMYFSGDGIRKSCSQARVLLTAASKNGNIEAKVKLKELDVKGCR